MAKTKDDMDMTKNYNCKGMRMTDCCSFDSTYHCDVDYNQILCCKKCWHEVSMGEGDGEEYLNSEFLDVECHENKKLRLVGPFPIKMED